MKPIFITVPLLTLMVAPSFAQQLKIPEAMLGTWCYAGDKGEFVPLSAAPLNSNGVPDCRNADETLFVDRKGYGDMRSVAMRSARSCAGEMCGKGVTDATKNGPKPCDGKLLKTARDLNAK